MEVRKEETGMIKAENLTKRFYDTVAVDHIHAEIHNGSVFGLIGTNGAGKVLFADGSRYFKAGRRKRYG